jgi:hypothetical protein
VSVATETADARIERLLVELATDENAAARARALVGAVLDWHKDALARMLELTRAHAGGDALVSVLQNDPQVGSMLALHDLVPVPVPVPELAEVASALIPVGRLLERPARGTAEPADDSCELCGARVPGTHDHLLDPASRQLRCVCPVCVRVEAARDGAVWKRVEHRAELVPGDPWADDDWARLSIPIGLAFFQRSSVHGKTVAYYPSPAGAVLAEAASSSWDDLVRSNPATSDLEPDIEALLVHRVGSAREQYRVSIDQAYALVGLLRQGWRGVSGGIDVWRKVTSFFERLRRGEGAHA